MSSKCEALGLILSMESGGGGTEEGKMITLIIASCFTLKIFLIDLNSPSFVHLDKVWPYVQEPRLNGGTRQSGLVWEIYFPSCTFLDF